MNVNYCIIIPCYNAEKTIGLLLKRIREIVGLAPIIVVNDGSTDKTESIIGTFKEIKTIHNKTNKGKGFSLKKGLNFAKKLGYEYAIVLDSDLQHPPEYLPDFIKRMKTKTELIIGKRKFSLKEMPFHRILSNTITSLLISIRTGKRIHDSQCGFRAYRLKDFKSSLYKENGFQFESEYLIRNLGRKDFKVTEIPIPTLYFSNSDSKIKNIKDTFRFIALFFKSYLWV